MAPCGSNALLVLLVAGFWIHSAPAQQAQQLPADNKDVTTTTPGPPTSPSTTGPGETGSRARAINLTTMGDGNASLADVEGNGHPEATTLRAKTNRVPLPGERRLDDVSMDDDDNQESAVVSSTSSSVKPVSTSPASATPPSSSPGLVEVAPSTVLPTCTDSDGKVYVEGQRFSKACDQMCTCAASKVTCTPRCKAPFLRRGARADPLCVEKDSDDPCCVLLVCSSESEPEPTESCTFKNKTYSRGQTFFDACESTCSCGAAGNVTCKQRCPPNEAKMSDRCVAVPDPDDTCCTVVLCDVTLGDHDVGKPAMTSDEAIAMRLQLSGAEALNSTAVRVSGEVPENATVEASLDGRLWLRQDALRGSGAAGVVLTALQPGRTYFIRLRLGGDMGNAVEVSLPPSPTTVAPALPAAPATNTTTASNSTSAGQCTYKGKSYALDEEFHDGCQAFCACTATGMECAPLECPTDFGLDLLDPECLDWETVPRNFVAQPPHCCPEKVACRNNGSCVYAGQRFPNYSEIPTKVTGCEQRCFCEYGNVTCETVCPPLSPTPPLGLPCAPQQAIVGHQHDDDCCVFWMCPQPPHFGKHPGNDTDPGPRPSAPPPSSSKAPFPLVLAPTAADPASSPPPSSPPARTQGPFGVLAPPAPSRDDPPFPGPFAPPKTTKSQTKSPSKSPPGFAGPFAPTLSPDAKHKTHYIGPFRIDDNEDVKPTKPTKTSVPAFSDIVGPPGVHLLPGATGFHGVNGGSDVPAPPDSPGPSGVHLLPGSSSGHGVNGGPDVEGRPDVQGVPGAPGLHGRPAAPAGQRVPGAPGQHGFPGIPGPHGIPGFPLGQDYEDHDENEEHQFHPQQVHDGHPGNYFPADKKNVNPEYQIIAVVPPHQGPPPYQAVPPYQQVAQPPGQRVPGIPPGQRQSQRRPTPEELLYLQHVHSQDGAQGVAGVPGEQQGGADLFLLHNQQGLHVPQGPHPHGPPGTRGPPVPPEIHEQIIAHLREQGALGKNQQPHPQPPPRPHPFPPHHGQGLGLEHEDDLATETSRHPALHQQLAQLLGNHSYPGFPEGALPPGFPQHSGIGRQDEVTVQTLEAVDEGTVRLVFSVPTVLVGLHGRVELRYTADVQNNDPSSWEQQVLAPPGDLIATPQLEFELGGLQADTVYKIKITVVLRDLGNTPSSQVLQVRTLPRSTPATTQPPQIPVDAELTVAEVNASWARITWRKATPFEINFIDGVQLRYKEIDGKVYAATPLIHRAVTSYTLEGLRPDTQYEVGIYFIPFTGQTTELLSEKTITFTTGIENDPYKFELTLDVHHIKSTSVELSWQGVPYPEDKFVNIFRAIYQSDAGKEDFSSFKIAKRDSPPKTMIQDLKPGTRYRLWLEAYLTNGRIKKSNVQDFITKPGSVPSAAGSTQQGKLEGTPLAEVSDYYGPLVAVAIIATLAILTSLALTLLLLKKCAQSKAAISTCRKSQSAYDNPSYKVEIQQETMDL